LVPEKLVHSSLPCSGVVVTVVVGVVVVGVVVGVVDSSSPVVTSSLVMLTSPVIVIPVLPICDATVISVVSGSSLNAFATSLVPSHASVTLVIWSRRIVPVAAIADATSSRVRSSSAALTPHDPAANRTSTCCRCTSARDRWHTAVVPSCSESMKLVSTNAVSEQFSAGRLMNPVGLQLRSVLYPKVYSAIASFSVATALAQAVGCTVSSSVVGSEV
jgi:hypothetical protein